MANYCSINCAFNTTSSPNSYPGVPTAPRSVPDPLSGTSAKVQMLGEKQLLDWVDSLPTTSFEPSDPSTLEKIWIKRLLPRYREYLFQAIPAEQLYSPQTPTVNVAIKEKQIHDFETICKNPVYRHPNLIAICDLPPLSEVKVMTPEAINFALRRVTEAVSSMIRTVHYNPKNVSPEALLRNPQEMTELLTRYSFYELIDYDNSFSFEKTSESVDFMTKKVTERICAFETLAQVTKEISVSVPQTAVELIQQLQTILSLLPECSDENFQNLCADAISFSSRLALDQQTLINSLCGFLRSQKESFTPFYLFGPSIDEFLEGPAFGKEEKWVADLPKLTLKFSCLTYLSNAVRQFLNPFLSGEITPATEEVNRKELKDSLLPEFHKTFPQMNVADSWLELLLLSMYIKIAAQGLTLTGLQNAYVFMEEQAEIGSTIHGKKALEIQEGIDSFLQNFISGLKHSLHIDFKSMHLTDKEIEWLANKALFEPALHLSQSWRKGV